MDYLNAFLCGGVLCAIGQFLIDRTQLTPARILTGYVVAGVLLQAVGVYQYLVCLLYTSLLTAYGIPCFKYYDKEGGAGKVINGFSGFGVGLYVPASMAEDAQNLLASMPMPNEADE